MCNGGLSEIQFHLTFLCLLLHCYHCVDTYLGPPQVKCRLLISSIFDAMNFQHFSEFIALKMLEIKSRHLT